MAFLRGTGLASLGSWLIVPNGGAVPVPRLTPLQPDEAHLGGASLLSRLSGDICENAIDANRLDLERMLLDLEARRMNGLAKPARAWYAAFW